MQDLAVCIKSMPVKKSNSVFKKKYRVFLKKEITFSTGYNVTIKAYISDKIN